jgi:membrane peptidoglycan carboxypeptidase
VSQRKLLGTSRRASALTMSMERAESAAQSTDPDYWQPGLPPRRRRLARLLRFVRRFLLICLALGLTFAVGFGILLLATPSVGNAKELAVAQDRSHGAPYPGPPVPYRFATALKATEDHRFDSEPGVDPIAVGRVIVYWVRGEGDAGGATLYQQLAKMLYTPGQSGVITEAEQVALAVKLKFSYSGAEILRLYSDVAYFGHGYYGLREASCGYFGVQPAQLSWPQAAMMAGLVQGPTTDDPLEHPANGRAREEHVIGRLVAVGALSQRQADAALAVPLRTLLRNAGGCRG